MEYGTPSQSRMTEKAVGSFGFFFFEKADEEKK
jgi:hypothetical protein